MNFELYGIYIDQALLGERGRLEKLANGSKLNSGFVEKKEGERIPSPLVKGVFYPDGIGL
jgi:hypothetical protein